MAGGVMTEALPSHGEPASSAPTVYATIVELMRGQPWLCREEPLRKLVSFDYEGRAGSWRTYATAMEDAQQVAVYGVVPFSISPPYRVIAAELISRINFGLVIGNFEMDFEDGEVRYKTSLDFEGAALTSPLFLQLVRSNLSVMDHYLSTFVAITTCHSTAVEALAGVDLEG
jgi:hypothetical protein